MLGHKQKVLGHVPGCAGAWLRHWYEVVINVNVLTQHALATCLEQHMVS